MSMKTRNAFTLVELLVVIAIIGTLASMTIPAVMQAVESSRRSVCQNNLKSLGQAVQTYKSKTDGAFPGYRQQIGQGINPANNGQGIRVPWTVVLLNHLEQANLYKQWRKTADPANLNAALGPELEVYICPSRPDIVNGPILSYVMNCGEGAQQAGNIRNLANGLGVDRFAFPGLRATDAMLEDGASYTLLFSENMQGGSWTSSEKRTWAWFGGKTILLLRMRRSTRINVTRRPQYRRHAPPACTTVARISALPTDERCTSRKTFRIRYTGS